MVSFSTIIKKFDQQGEKTGWTYIEIAETQAQKLNPGIRKGYQVKGQLDELPFKGLNLLPMGDGNFILALKAEIRKALGKKKGDRVNVQLEVDTKTYQINKDLLDCLADEPAAAKAFYKMPPSHQKYYSKWVESAKTTTTRAKRIAISVNALAAGLDYGAMLRKEREDRRELGF